MMVESVPAMSMRFLRPVALCTHRSSSRSPIARATISLRWESSPSPQPSPARGEGVGCDGCEGVPLSPRGRGDRGEGGFSLARRIKSIASPWPSQRNSSAPFNSRCSAAATSSSKSSCEGTVVTVIAISMTVLNPVMNLRVSSQEGGSASNLAQRQSRPIVGSRCPIRSFSCARKSSMYSFAAWFVSHNTVVPALCKRCLYAPHRPLEYPRRNSLQQALATLIFAHS